MFAEAAIRGAEEAWFDRLYRSGTQEAPLNLIEVG
jgi:hypothetical protein